MRSLHLRLPRSVGDSDRVRPVTVYDEYVAQTQAPGTIEIRSQVTGLLDRQSFADGTRVKKGTGSTSSTSDRSSPNWLKPKRPGPGASESYQCATEPGAQRAADRPESGQPAGLRHRGGAGAASTALVDARKLAARRRAQPRVLRHPRAAGWLHEQLLVSRGSHHSAADAAHHAVLERPDVGAVQRERRQTARAAEAVKALAGRAAGSDRRSASGWRTAANTLCPGA